MNNYLVIAYEIITGLFESAIGLGLIIFEKKIVGLYLKLRFSGFLGSHHDFLIRLAERFVPAILVHHLLIGLLLILIGIVKVIGGVGMVYKKQWAPKLLLGLLLVLLPLDVLGLLQHVSATKVVFLLINVAIILILRWKN